MTKKVNGQKKKKVNGQPDLEGLYSELRKYASCSHRGSSEDGEWEGVRIRSMLWGAEMGGGC